ncbi:hypothetical protein BH10ACI2_BH10ACI2_24740 [soil metagenome]
MNKLIPYCLLVLITVVGVYGVSGQTQGDLERQRAEQEREDRQRQQRELLERIEKSQQIQLQKQREAAMRRTSVVNNERSKERKTSAKSLDDLYRKSNKSEQELLAPEKDDLTLYAEFLRGSNTGLTKFAADNGCADDSNIVVSTGDCILYSMPGAGNSYSFRLRDYRIAQVADLSLMKLSFVAKGDLQQGIIVRLGDVPIAGVDQKTAGLQFLRDFKPDTTVHGAAESQLRFETGVPEGGFLYQRYADVIENMTYAMRSIAYRGHLIKSVLGVNYDQMQFDSRRDITVAFRVVRRPADGSVTILWKILSDKKAPELKRDKK